MNNYWCEKSKYRVKRDYTQINDTINDQLNNTKTDWYTISGREQLSEHFISNHKWSVVWSEICKWQVLSTNFLREHHSFISWKHVSRFQELDIKFIQEYKDKIDWKEYKKYRPITFNILRLFSRYLFKFNLFFDTNVNTFILLFSN